MPLVEDWGKVIRTLAPNANASFVSAAIPAIEPAMMRYGLGKPLRAAHFLGHCAHECGFRSFAENLNYSASRLIQVWPNRFNSSNASRYAKNPEALGNFVYANRMGNEGPESGDGFRFRGSAMVHHTGEDEFERVKKRTGVDVVKNPDLLRDPKNAALMVAAGASYFADRAGMLAACDADDITKTTKLLNGGTNGLADRKTKIARAKLALVECGVSFDSLLTGRDTVADTVAAAERKTVEERASNARTAGDAGAAAGAGTGAAAGGALATDVVNVGAPPWFAAVVVGGFLLVGAGVLIYNRRRARQIEEEREPRFVEHLENMEPEGVRPNGS